MGGIKITIEGDVQLRAKLTKCKSMTAVKTVVQKHGDALNVGMKRATTSAFTKGYSTGQTARSINTETSDGGLTATVQPGTDYAAYVEYGTRKMAAEPFVRPAFDAEAPKFVSDLKKLVR